eukprot:TRINITY_DN6904_c0_g1_i1.p1 TRINITY_DN6904_c0_g1~~TRINITY_DN6904_c0_g1_i1.p1  ORF type:complete len:807 (+),score=203.66 TRINITY_DN6904_c0_g1_i1:57-2477(+)
MGGADVTLEIVDGLHRAMDGLGKDGRLLFKYLPFIKNQEHWEKCKALFKERHPTFNGGDLAASLLDELSAKEFERAEAELAERKIVMIPPRAKEEVIADNIHRAMKHLRGVRAEEVYAELQKVDDAQEWQRCCAAFRERHPAKHGGDLIAALKEEMNAKKLQQCDDILVPKHVPPMCAPKPPKPVPQQIAEDLYAAFRGWGHNEQLLHQTLSRVEGPEQWKAVQDAFAATFPKPTIKSFNHGDLIGNFHDELKPNELARCNELLQPKGVQIPPHPSKSKASQEPNGPPAKTAKEPLSRVDQLAEDFYLSMKGWGTDEEALYHAMTQVRDAGEFAAVEAAFAQRYPKFNRGSLRGSIFDELTKKELRVADGILRPKGVYLLDNDGSALPPPAGAAAAVPEPIQPRESVHHHHHHTKEVHTHHHHHHLDVPPPPPPTTGHFRPPPTLDDSEVPPPPPATVRGPPGGVVPVPSPPKPKKAPVPQGQKIPPSGLPAKVCWVVLRHPHEAHDFTLGIREYMMGGGVHLAGVGEGGPYHRAGVPCGQLLAINNMPIADEADLQRRVLELRQARVIRFPVEIIPDAHQPPPTPVIKPKSRTAEAPGSQPPPAAAPPPEAVQRESDETPTEFIARRLHALARQRREGWVSAAEYDRQRQVFLAHLALLGQQQHVAPPQAAYAYTKGSQGVHLLSGPGHQFAKVRRGSVRGAVTVQRVEGRWMYVKTADGVEGYVRDELLTSTPDSPTPWPRPAAEPRDPNAPVYNTCSLSPSPAPTVEGAVWSSRAPGSAFATIRGAAGARSGYTDPRYIRITG